MCILNVCGGGSAKLYFTKQPEQDLFKKIEIIDGLQEKADFENKTCEQIVFKDFNSLSCCFSCFLSCI